MFTATVSFFHSEYFQIQFILLPNLTLLQYYLGVGPFENMAKFRIGCYVGILEPLEPEKCESKGKSTSCGKKIS